MPFPLWARELSEKYYSRSFAMFVLYGNVRDLVPIRSRKKRVRTVGRVSFRASFASATWFSSTTAAGCPSSADMKADFGRALAGYDSFHGTNYSQGGLPRNPDGVLNILDNYLRLRIADDKKIAVVIDFAETIAPAGDSSGMSAEDRNSLVILKRWAQNPLFCRPTSHSA